MNGAPTASRTFRQLLAVLAIAFAIRFLWLSADPSRFMGLHFISDEGWWIHNARNKALFGTWILDEFNQSLLVSPVVCLFTWFVYSLAGVGFATSRVVPALSGFLSIIVFYRILKSRGVAPRHRVAGAVFAGLNFAFAALNRIAFVDSTAYLFVLLCWLFLETGSRKPIRLLLSGVFAGLAVITKSYALSLAPVLAAVYLHRTLLNRPDFRRIARRAALFFSGVLVTFLAWYAVIFLPFQDEYRVMYHLWRDGNIPSGMAQALRNAPSLLYRTFPGEFHLSRFIWLNASLILLAGYRLVRLLIPGGRSWKAILRDIPLVERDALIWLVIVVCLVAPLTAKPFRRYIFWYPPLIILALGALTPPAERLQDARNGAARFWNPWSLFSAAVFSLLPAIYLAPLLFRVLKALPGLPGKPFLIMHVKLSGLLLTGVAAGIFAIVFFMKKLYARRLPAVPLAAGLALFLVWNGSLLATSFSRLSFSLRDTSIRLGEQYFGNDLVLGGIAGSLCIENSARTLAIWGRQEAACVLNQNPVERFHPRYLLLLKTLDGRPWIQEERYYKHIKQADFIEEIRLLPVDGRYRVTAELYRFR